MKKLDDLRSRVRGQVLLDGDDGFEQARQPWNRAIDQPVAAVVAAADAADVAALVRYARDRGLPVSAQPTGHGASGGLDGVILLRTARLDEVTVDAAARTARVGAGVLWGRVQAAAAPYGLTGLPGSSPVVGVVGYTLGGGLGWFARRYGWAADSVTAFDVVDADGGQSRVTAGSDPDLFWALRGGGGGFALVTAIEFGLHPAPALYGGRVVWPAGQASAVLDAFRQITADAPDELTVWADLLQFPGAPPMVGIDATYLGDAAEGAALLKPLDRIEGPISDTRAPMPLTDLGSITAEPTDPSPGIARGELLTALDDAAVRVLLADPVDPLISVQIRHLGGALTRPSDSPHGPLSEPYGLNLYGRPSEAVRARQHDLVHALKAYVRGRKPYTTLAPGETVAAAFTPQTLARLQDIKRRHDPGNLIRANFPVSP